MIDREKKIAEIREALEKATPGPWVADDENGIIWSTDAKVVFNFTADEEEGDVNLIANAPEWLEWAVQEIERLREENEGRKKIIEAYMRIEHDLAEDAERYLQQRDKLIEVLRFYAQRNDVNTVSLMLSDKGQRARDILKEIGVTVE